MKLIWENLQKFGYKRAGMVLWDHQLHARDWVWEAAHFYAQVSSSSETQQKIPSLTFKYGKEIDRNVFKNWIRKWKPEAIISSINDLYRILPEEGLRIPQNMGFLSLHASREISGLDQGSKQIAEIGIRLLDQLITSRKRGFPEHQQTIQINGRWNPGTTLKTIRT